MNPINASSLFHFTKRKTYLKGILTKGFRCSYCIEKVTKAIVMNKEYPDKASFISCNPNIHPYVAMPMVCFCDIPLTRTKEHSKIYGKYIIGIDKQMAQTIYGELLNQIQYISSTMLQYALNNISVLKAKCMDVEGCKKDITSSINQIIGMTKPYKGDFRKYKGYCFSEEHEWRILLPSNYDNKIKWYWNISPEEFNEKKNGYNEILYTTSHAYVGFVEDLCEQCDKDNFSRLITHIVVPKDDIIPEFVDFILNEKQPLFGYKNISSNIRRILVSKITSFERIENDY